ncbi:MAG: hypothetical protein WAM14_07545 [Candidatus Nitrosopolaris sp.]
MSLIATKVIIPKFADYDSNYRYFIPRFAKIQRGQSIQWTNLDNIPHNLVFQDEESRRITTLGPIEPKTFRILEFRYDASRIDYYCDIHGNETGSVIIFSQNEETMTNTERLRFLGKIFNINPPDVYAHLKG